jgi:hypothetical protein
MVELEWKEPPNAGRGRGTALTDWFEVARQLRERPREWALVLNDVSRVTGTRINNGHNAAFRDGYYEAVTRGHGPRSHTHGDLYIRYLGAAPEWEDR